MFIISKSLVSIQKQVALCIYVRFIQIFLIFQVSFYNCQNEESDDDSSSIKSEQQSPNALTIDEQIPSNDISSTKKSQICNICGKILSSPSSFYVHMKMHSENKPYACTVSFYSQGLLFFQLLIKHTSKAIHGYTNNNRPFLW